MVVQGAYGHEQTCNFLDVHLEMAKCKAYKSNSDWWGFFLGGGAAGLSHCKNSICFLVENLESVKSQNSPTQR